MALPTQFFELFFAIIMLSIVKTASLFKAYFNYSTQKHFRQDINTFFVLLSKLMLI